MGNVGNLPATNYESSLFQDFGSTSGVGPHTLDYSVASSADILVYVNNVAQEPDVGFTVSGDQLTTDNLSSDSLYVRFLALARQTVTPPTNSINASMLVTGTNQWTGMIGGLTCSNDTDADHDVNITAGYARSYADDVTMVLTSEITKQIDATWAVGDDAGGLDTGSVTTNTGYGVYLIRRSDTGVVDALFSTDMSSAGSSVTMPTNYDQKRLIGWVRTDGSSNILQFRQTGDYFRLARENAASRDINDSTITNSTYETGTLTSPPSCVANVMCYFANTSSTSTAQYTWIRQIDSTLGVGSDYCYHSSQWGGSLTGDTLGFTIDLYLDESSQFQYACTEATGSASFIFTMLGCNMLTRSNPI